MRSTRGELSSVNPWVLPNTPRMDLPRQILMVCPEDVEQGARRRGKGHPTMLTWLVLVLGRPGGRGSLLSVLCLVVVLSVHPNPSSFRGAGEELAEARQSSLPPAQGMEKVMWLRNNVE